MKRNLATVGVMILTFARLASAAEQPEALAKLISPYVDDAALFVAHVDLARADLGPTQKALTNVMGRLGLPKQQLDAMTQQLGQGMDMARQWIATFTKAGGQDIFLVMTPAGLPEAPVYAVVPLRAGANAAALTEQLQALVANAGPEWVVETHGAALIVGGKSLVAQLKALKAHARPDLASAFEAAGDGAAIRIAFAPSADARRVLNEMLPKPPPELLAGGDSPIRQISWIGAGITLSPALTLHTVIRSPDAGAAAGLGKTMNAALTMAREGIITAMKDDPNLQKVRAELERLTGALAPKIEGDRVTLHLAADQTLAATAVIAPAIAKARAQAAQVRSASQIRMILQHCLIYANERKGEYPPDLATLTKAGDVPPELLQHPGSAPGSGIRYVYLRPTMGWSAPADQVVIYEQANGPLDRLNVGFGDGHVDLMERAKFENLLAESKARNEQKK